MSTLTIGFLPQASEIAPRTARRTASRTISGSLRRACGMLFSVPSTASSATSYIASPRSVSCGTPSSANCGYPRISPRGVSVIATIAMPTCMSLRRSRTGPSLSGTISRPSRNNRPVGTSSTIRGCPGAINTTSPLSGSTTVATPAARAKRPCSLRWRASPCIGIATFGLIQAYICLSSSRRGCPVTCTSASLSVITSTPRWARLF